MLIGIVILLRRSKYRHRPGSDWRHEDASEMMLDYLVSDNNVDLKPDEVEFIKDLIAGEKTHSASQ
jgi:deoxynucleoside triphosphate triphosphohydrolase SAMHD1